MNSANSDSLIWDAACYASYRFERGMDLDGPVRAIDRCCHLYQELAGGEVRPGAVDEYR